MLVRHARHRHENRGIPSSAPPITGAPEPRRPKLGKTLRLPQTGQRDRRAGPRGVTSSPSGERIAPPGKCPGRPTIETPVDRSRSPKRVRELLVGPLGLVADDLTWATSFRARGRGVLLRPRLGPGQALVISPCRQVHTFGVRYPLDAVFCDRDLRVLHVETLAPRRVSRRVAGARYCVELLGGRAQATGLYPGSLLSFEEPP